MQTQRRKRKGEELVEREGGVLSLSRNGRGRGKVACSNARGGSVSVLGLGVVFYPVDCGVYHLGSLSGI